MSEDLIAIKIAHTIRKYQDGPSHIRVGDFVLTRSQVTVLVGLAYGLEEKQLADVLHRHHKTVQKHSQSVKYKIRVHSLTGMTHFAIKHGLIKAGDCMG